MCMRPCSQALLLCTGCSSCACKHSAAASKWQGHTHTHTHTQNTDVQRLCNCQHKNSQVSSTHAERRALGGCPSAEPSHNPVHEACTLFDMGHTGHTWEPQSLWFPKFKPPADRFHCYQASDFRCTTPHHAPHARPWSLFGLLPETVRCGSRQFLSATEGTTPRLGRTIQIQPPVWGVDHQYRGEPNQ